MIRCISEFIRFKLIPEWLFVRLKYMKYFGHFPNLNNPTTLNEKIQWLKLYYRNPKNTRYADKYEVRKIVKEQIGEKHLIPLIFFTDDVTKIEKENLPDYPFIIKTNHGCGAYRIIRNKNKVNWNKLRKYFRRELKSNYYYKGKEFQYKYINPLILVEKLLLCKNNKVPYDYKVHCFNGKPEFIYVTSDREGNTKRDLYTIDWQPIEFIWSHFDKKGNPEYKPGNKIDKPKNLNQILELSEKLASDFKDIYVRVDLYNVDEEEIYFGEYTFHHMGGFAEIRPRSWDIKLGEKLRLPENKIIN